MYRLLILLVLVGCTTPASDDAGPDAQTSDAQGTDAQGTDAQGADAETSDAQGADAADSGLDAPTDGGMRGAPLANLSADGTLDMRMQTPERPLAFPGAGGYGQNVTGGRGGTVVTVTTTADNCTAGDGQVTWREALTSCGDVENTARYILFAVGGVFPRTMNLDNGRPAPLVGDSNITIACQSAPGPVVLQETIHFWTRRNIVARHCHLRGQGQHALGAGTDRALDFAESTDVMLDHLSISWHQDAEFQAYNGRGADTANARITLQYTIAARGDGSEPTTPGSFNSALGPHCLSNHDTLAVEGCSFLNNYSAHQWSRTIGLWGANGEVLNNLLYNFHTSGVSSVSSPGAYPPGSIHAINNLVVDGPVRHTDNNPFDTERNRVRAIQRDNFVLERSSDAPYEGNIESAPAYETTHEGTPAIEQSGEVSEDIRVLARSADTDYMRCLGASRWGQDVYDREWIADLYAKTGPVRNEFGVINRDYSSYEDTRHSEDYDTDGDGIADEWERWVIESGAAASLSDIDSTTDLDGDGYPSIEEFLSWRARCPAP